MSLAENIIVKTCKAASGRLSKTIDSIAHHTQLQKVCRIKKKPKKGKEKLKFRPEKLCKN